MTQLLNQAFQEASKLPQLQQNMIARWLLEEINVENKWDELLADSEDMLESLADEALQEHLKGKSMSTTIVQANINEDIKQEI